MNRLASVHELLTKQLPVAVIGLGYVGLPLAVCLARRFRVIAFDIDQTKIGHLRSGEDPTSTCTSADLLNGNLHFTALASDLHQAGVLIVAVPTPVDQTKRPDFTPLKAACVTVGRNLRPGAVVVFESTVYPGATAEVCVPLIERESGLKAGVDFYYGYSPERINPGDPEHTIEKICKVVSAMNAEALDVVAGIYGAVIPAGVFRASSVEVAEAAKVIENTQRDLNIALVNELALICHRLGIDTLDVLKTAGTKWNFLPFTPGLVGGHCIGVDPYYLTHKAACVGYHPEVILAGRRINDGMGNFVAQECVRLLIETGIPLKGARVIVAGLTFKENCPDLRNSRVVDIVTELRRFGITPVLCDPIADPRAVEEEFGSQAVAWSDLPDSRALILAVPHRHFRSMTIAELTSRLQGGAPVLDVKGVFERSSLAAAGFAVWRL